MQDAQRWILSLSAIIVLGENPESFEALRVLGAKPRPRNTASAVTGLSDAWSVTTTAQLEKELAELMASKDEERAFVLGRAADVAQMGYSAYLITRETAWSWLVRLAEEAQRTYDSFRAFAESYRAGVDAIYADDDDQEELAEIHATIDRLLSDPESPWVTLPFKLPLAGVEMPQETGRTWRVDGTIAAALAKASDGDRIIVPEGTYRERIRVSTPEWDEDEKDPWMRAPSVELNGEGRVVITHDDGPVIVVDDGGLVLEGIRIENERAKLADPEDIDGDVAQVADGSLRLVRCDVSAKAGRGLVIFEAGQLVECGIETGGFPAVLSARVVVMDRCVTSGGGVVVKEDGDGFLEDCQLTNGAYSALEVHDSANVTATRCVFSRSKGAGVGVFDRAEVRLSHCEMTHNENSGLAVQGGKAAAIDCKMISNATNGARFEGPVHGTITRCELRENGAAAIFWLERAHVTVTQSTAISHGTGGGIVIENANGQVSHTTIEGSLVNAIEVNGEGAPVFHGCTIRGNGGNGVLVNGSKPRLHECTIKDGKLSGVYIQAGEPRITRCEISGHEGAGIVSEAGGGNVIDCKIHHNAQFAVQAGARLSVRDCQLTDNGEDGVYVRDGGDIALERCELARNGDCNVRLYERGHARIVDCTIHHAKSDGVFAEGECKVDLDACDVFENGDYGLYVMEQTKATAKKSHFHANVKGNVFLQNDASASVVDSATDDLVVEDEGRVTLTRTLVRTEIKKQKGAKVTQKEPVTKARPFEVPRKKKPKAEDDAEVE